MFQEPSQYTQKASLWGLADLFYCYAQSFERTGHPLKIISHGQTQSENRLTFNIDYVDNTKLATAIIHYYQIYQGAGWSHIIKAINLLNSITDCHMHSISAHYISVHQKFINKQQPC